MPIARHVYHVPTSGSDRLHALMERTGEPFFVWGRSSGQVEGYWFASVKRAFRKWLQATASAEVTVYHDGVGSDALGPMDPCPRKLLFMHHWFPRWERSFEWMLRCTGEVAVSDRALADLLHQRFSWIPRKYVHDAAPVALEPARIGEGATGPGQRTGIWLHGRLWKSHGNRLRSIIDRWQAFAGELEIICSGRNAPRWGRDESIKWSLDLPLEFALHRLHTWDSTLLLNDYSLDAPWLLRALELGIFPLIPEGKGLTRQGPWKAASAPRGYPWGEVPAAMELLQEWRSQRDDLERDFRQWVLAVRAPAEQFDTRWKEVHSRMLEHRPPRLRSRKAISSAFPVGLYERVLRLRVGVG